MALRYWGSPLELVRCAPLEFAVRGMGLVVFLSVLSLIERRFCLAAGLLGIVRLLVRQRERWLGVLLVLMLKHLPLE